MMEKLKALAMIGLCLLAFWCAFHLSRDGDTNRAEKSTQALDVLKKENDSLSRVNDTLKRQIAGLEILADSLMGIAEKNRKKISELKTRQDERIKAIGDFTSSELYRFFAKAPTTRHDPDTSGDRGRR